MSRTLSANATAGKGGSSNPVWLVQMDSSGGTYYFATETFVDLLVTPHKTYYGNRLLRKTGLGKIKQAVRIEEGGAFEEITDFSLLLANADLYSDTIAAEFFENRRVEVRLIFADKTAPSWANGIKCFFGYVNETPQFDFDKMTFKCTRGQRKWSRKLPPIILSEDRFSNLPQANRGKVAPIILGDWTGGAGLNRSALASNRSPSSAEIIHRDYFKVLLLDEFKGAGDLSSGVGNPAAVIACHDMALLPPANQNVYKFAWDSERGCWHKVKVKYDSAGWAETYADLYTAHPYLDASAAQKTEKVFRFIPLLGATNILNGTELNGIDEDDSNHTDLDANAYYVRYDLPFRFDGSMIKSLKVYWQIVGNGVSGGDKVVYRMERTGETFQAADCPTNNNFNSVDLTSVWPDTVEGGSIGGLTAKFTRSGSNGGTFEIMSVFVEVVTEDAEVKTEFYETGKGLYYGSWIDDEHTPNPGLAEGDVVENAAYAIEALLISYGWIGADIGDISVAGFDSVATNKASWKLARQILEPTDLFDLIRKICYEFGFACFLRPDGTFCVRRIDATGDSVTTYDKSSMLYPGGQPSIKVERGSLKNMYNDFVLRYKVNMATGEPEKILFVRSPDAASYDSSYANLADESSDFWQYCSDAYDQFQQVNLWDYTANWIRDDATAELFLKKMILLLTRVPYKVTFQSALDLIGLELLDECKISHALLPTGISGASRFRLIEQEIDPATDTIKNVLQEVI